MSLLRGFGPLCSSIQYVVRQSITWFDMDLIWCTHNLTCKLCIMSFLSNLMFLWSSPDICQQNVIRLKNNVELYVKCCVMKLLVLFFLSNCEDTICHPVKALHVYSFLLSGVSISSLIAPWRSVTLPYALSSWFWNTNGGCVQKWNSKACLATCSIRHSSREEWNWLLKINLFVRFCHS